MSEEYDMRKLNCWEVKKCGRELGGIKAYELGVCPAATEISLDGVHGGINAGRACWVVAGTMCNGNVQGTFAEKYRDCGTCDFYLSVKEEEGENFMPTTVVISKLDDSEDSSSE
jgi:hypothetical protein